jgi:SAM-dependent methyltransferase
VTGDRWWRGFDGFVLRDLTPHARVLEVGCGDGSLVERLATAGLDAVGVDPNAPAGPRFVRERAEHVEGIGRFDAVCSVMALHHADLDPVLAAIGGLLRPGGLLFVCEFSWESYDDRAAAWAAAHDPDRDSSVSAWLAEHDELHPGARVKASLDGSFEADALLARPYLARMLGRHELEGEEHAAIERGRVPAVGWWYRGALRRA